MILEVGMSKDGFSGLVVSMLVSDTQIGGFKGSNPAEAIGFLQV